MVAIHNTFRYCREQLLDRLKEQAPGRIQLRTGVDAVFDESWGKWAVEVKTGRFDARALRGLLEFCRRNSAFKPLVISAPGHEELARRHQIASVSWEDFLLRGRTELEESPARGAL